MSWPTDGKPRFVISKRQDKAFTNYGAEYAIIDRAFLHKVVGLFAGHRHFTSSAVQRAAKKRCAELNEMYA